MARRAETTVKAGSVMTTAAVTTPSIPSTAPGPHCRNAPQHDVDEIDGDRGQRGDGVNTPNGVVATPVVSHLGLSGFGGGVSLAGCPLRSGRKSWVEDPGVHRDLGSAHFGAGPHHSWRVRRCCRRSLVEAHGAGVLGRTHQAPSPRSPAIARNRSVPATTAGSAAADCVFSVTQRDARPPRGGRRGRRRCLCSPTPAALVGSRPWHRLPPPCEPDHPLHRPSRR